MSRGIRVVTNGGGVNPVACRDALFAVARQKGVHGLKIGVVRGNDILFNVDELIASGATLANMEPGEPLSSIRKRLISANVYFGAAPIVEALEQGAQIVITGRTTDTGTGGTL